jgi:hypothetical protein
VKQLVQNLNSHIFHTAASMTDTFLSSNNVLGKVSNTASSLDEDVPEGARSFLHQDIILWLHGQRLHDDYEAVFQSALQAALTHHCVQTLASWPLKGGRLLESIYRYLRQTGTHLSFTSC